MTFSTILNTKPITIPVDYCGHHTMYPAGDSLPAVAIQNVRSYAYYFAANVNWYSVERSAGVYTWTALDAMFTAWRTAGWTVTWSLRGTPAFYTSDVISDGNNNDGGPHLGGYGFPDLDTNLTATKAFVTAVINRYNSPTGAWRIANPTLGKGIVRAAAINEPQFTTNGNFWHGTYTQSVDMSKAFYDAVKAADPTVLVASPALIDPVVKTPTFMTTYGTIYPAVQGYQTCDYLDFHDYTAMPYGSYYASFVNDIVSIVSSYQAISSKYFGSAPMTMSEYGFDGGLTDLALTSLLAESPLVRFTMLFRIMFTFAAMNGAQINLFRTGANYCGDWVGDTNGVMRAFNLMASLSGKTLLPGAKAIWNGPVTGVFTDGTTIFV